MTVKKVRILIVDDNRKFAETTASILASHGFDVQLAFSGKFALAKLHLSDFDLVITDIRMPEMDGIELIGKIRNFGPGQRIVVVTGFPSQSTAQQTFELGTLNYIAKPFSANRLLEIVNHALKKPKKSLVGCLQFTTEELIRLYVLAQETIVLEIRSNGDAGRIYFKQGRIVHAETENHQGEEAFYEIQSWSSGRFTAEPYDEKVTRTIERSVDALLFEGARRQEKRRKETLPSSNVEEEK